MAPHPSTAGRAEVDATAALTNLSVRGFVDRLVRLETERREIAEQLRDVLKEAESAGYHTGALRKLVRRELETEKQRAKREAEEQALELMRAELGVFAETPLGQAALAGAARHADRD